METLAQNTLKALSAQQQKSQDQEAVAPFCSCLFIVAIEENTVTIEVLWEIPWVAFLMPCVFTVWLPSGTGWLAHFALISCVQFFSPGNWYLFYDTRSQLKYFILFYYFATQNKLHLE